MSRSGTSPQAGNSFSPAQLEAVLQGLPDARQLIVAFSGGLDSSVLLHALVELGQRPLAVHINHGLQAGADDWQAHCERTCLRLGVDLRCEILAPPAQLSNIEAWARQQRYIHLQQHMQAGDAVVTAHHCDDQAETLLLRLMRGAGVRGLGGMSAVRTLGPGLLLRPLLGFERWSLETWAREQGIEWLDDPSNESDGPDRNFLRLQVLPLLRQRWPAVTRLMSRSSAHLQDADTLLDELACIDLGQDDPAGPLALTRLRCLQRHRALNLLGYWLRMQGCPMLPVSMQQELFSGLVNSRADASPELCWGGVSLRRHQDALVLVTQQTGPQAGQQYDWHTSAALSLPHGRLALNRNTGPIDPARLPKQIQVRFRRGGEICRLPGRPRKPLKKLLQEAAVPDWERDRLPLLYDGEHMLAIADRWVCEGYQCSNGNGVGIIWEPAATIRAKW